MPDSGGPVDQLARQAQSLRRNSAGNLRVRSQYNGLQKLIVSLFLLVTLAGATFLAVSQSDRQLLLQRLGSEWTRLYGSDADRGVFELPPPPPRRLEPQVILRSPVLVAEPQGEVYSAVPAENGDVTVEKTFIPPEKTPGFENAYQLLISESPAAGKLVKGELSDLRFKEWKPLQNKHPEYYVSLVAEQISDRTEVQFVWSVNTQSSRIQALSQAARDLDRRP